MPQQEILSPLKWLQLYNQKYPSAWKIIDSFRQQQGKGNICRWPNWCFCPLAGAYAAVTGGQISFDITRASDISSVGALAGWRQSKGIYRVDKEIFDSLSDTTINGEIPSEVLYKLPQWCVYVEIPEGAKFNPQQAKGFFAFLEYDARDFHSELIILLDADNILLPFILFLGGTIEDGFRKLLENNEKMSAQSGFPLKMIQQQLGIKGDEGLNDISKIISPYISVLLYLCSENADIKDSSGSRLLPSNPKSQKLKKGFRTVAADKVTIWNVGYQLADRLKKAKEVERTKLDDSTAETSSIDKSLTHASAKPHVRRAHWHGYWVGSKSDKHFVLKWLHPILVNALSSTSS